MAARGQRSRQQYGNFLEEWAETSAHLLQQGADLLLQQDVDTAEKGQEKAKREEQMEQASPQHHKRESSLSYFLKHVDVQREPETKVSTLGDDAVEQEEEPKYDYLDIADAYIQQAERQKQLHPSNLGKSSSTASSRRRYGTGEKRSGSRKKKPPQEKDDDDGMVAMFDKLIDWTWDVFGSNNKGTKNIEPKMKSGKRSTAPYLPQRKQRQARSKQDAPSAILDDNALEVESQLTLDSTLKSSMIISSLQHNDIKASCHRKTLSTVLSGDDEEGKHDGTVEPNAWEPDEYLDDNEEDCIVFVTSFQAEGEGGDIKFENDFEIDEEQKQEEQICLEEPEDPQKLLQLAEEDPEEYALNRIASALSQVSKQSKTSPRKPPKPEPKEPTVYTPLPSGRLPLVMPGMVPTLGGSNVESKDTITIDLDPGILAKQTPDPSEEKVVRSSPKSIVDQYFCIGKELSNNFLLAFGECQSGMTGSFDEEVVDFFMKSFDMSETTISDDKGDVSEVSDAFRTHMSGTTKSENTISDAFTSYN
eukprot:scaffold2113_cov145-Amphora_coffeaeformis.AAC.1